MDKKMSFLRNMDPLIVNAYKRIYKLAATSENVSLTRAPSDDSDSLCIRTVWSEPSLYVFWIAHDLLSDNE